MLFFITKVTSGVFFNILIFIVVSLLLTSLLLVLSFLFSQQNRTAEKISAYQCGFIPLDSGHIKLDIQFFIVAILFIVFDLEIILIFPWAVCAYSLGGLGFGVMIYFLLILTIGYIYEIQRGALDWSELESDL